MKVFRRFLIFFAFLLPLPGTGYLPLIPSQLQNELTELSRRGVSYRFVSPDLIELESKPGNPITGNRYLIPIGGMLKSMTPPILTVPPLTIDLRTLDTAAYSWKYHYKSTVPLSGEWGFPLQVRDLDRDGKVEAYGVYQTEQSYETRIYEIANDSDWVLRYTYPPETGRVDQLSDVDENGLSEVMTRFGDSLFTFEQSLEDTLPTIPKFRFREWYGDARTIPSQLIDLNGDKRYDLLYAGSEPDTFYPSIRKSFVADYDSSLVNLRNLWSARLPPDCIGTSCTGQLFGGDFDGDGLKEICTSSFEGNIYVIEFVDKDSFAVVGNDSLSVAGRVTAGDVDGNGKEEFFVGGDQLETDGFVHTRIVVYESISDNLYQQVFEFDIFPTGLFFISLYQTVDMDHDGQKELLLSLAGGVFIIKGIGARSYELFYYKPQGSLDGASGVPIDTSGVAHLFISKHLGTQQIIKQTDEYTIDSTLADLMPPYETVPSDITIYQNYPNPFNPTTTISFSLPGSGEVSLRIFNLLGEEVATLVSGPLEAGTHAVKWDATGQPSGVYFYRLTARHTDGVQAGDFTQTRKLLLLR